MEDQERAATIEFLESLSVEQMASFLKGPELFHRIVLEHAPDSEKVTDLIDQVLDKEYEGMTEEWRKRIDEVAKRLHQAHQG